MYLKIISESEGLQHIEMTDWEENAELDHSTLYPLGDLTVLYICTNVLLLNNTMGSFNKDKAISDREVMAQDFPVFKFQPPSTLRSTFP